MAWIDWNWTALGVIASSALTLTLIIITIYYAWQTKKQAATMAQQLRDEKLQNLQQVYTELEWRKTEILDLYMLIAQTKSESLFYQVVKSKMLSTSNSNVHWYDAEYYRKRQFEDKLIIELAKSSGRLIETLSRLDLLFANSKNLNGKTELIIENNYKFKQEVESRVSNLEDIINKEIQNVQNLQGDELSALRERLIRRVVDDLFEWLKANIIYVIDDILSCIKNEINAKKTKSLAILSQLEGT